MPGRDGGNEGRLLALQDQEVARGEQPWTNSAIRQRMVLFITWDGPNQPYLKSLFLPPFRRLAEQGTRFEVLQLSWGAQPSLGAADTGPIRVHRQSIPRRGFPLVYGPVIARAAAEVLRRTVAGDVLMPRSHLPLAIALAARALRPSLRIVWDMDGFMPDERADFGGWRRDGSMYRLFMEIERRGVTTAAVTIVRTEAARRELCVRYGGGVEGRIAVVPNGRDPAVFATGTEEARAMVRRDLGVPPDSLLIVYAGSLGPQYLPEQMAEVAGTLLRRLDAHWLVLTGMAKEAAKMVAPLGVLASRIHVRKVEPLEVPRWLAASDLGLALRADLPSQKGVAPVKIAEYLLCGLPVLTTGRVGDLERQLGSATVCQALDPGAAIDEAFLLATVARWWPAAREDVRVSARALGLQHFSLEATAAGYGAALHAAQGA